MPSRQVMLRRWVMRWHMRRSLGFFGATPKQLRPTAKRWPIPPLDTTSQPIGPASVFLQGWAKSRLAEMRHGLAIYREQGRIWLLPEVVVAEAEASAGETDAGLRRLNEALAELERTEERSYETEMHRIRAEILLKRDPANSAAAEESLQAAVAVAQSQKLRSFELRAALSLAKLYRAANRDADARAVLAPAVEGFLTTRQSPNSSRRKPFSRR